MGETAAVMSVGCRNVGEVGFAASVRRSVGGAGSRKTGVSPLHVRKGRERSGRDDAF